MSLSAATGRRYCSHAIRFATLPPGSANRPDKERPSPATNKPCIQRLFPPAGVERPAGGVIVARAAIEGYANTNHQNRRPVLTTAIAFDHCIDGTKRIDIRYLPSRYCDAANRTGVLVTSMLSCSTAAAIVVEHWRRRSPGCPGTSSWHRRRRTHCTTTGVGCFEIYSTLRWLIAVVNSPQTFCLFPH